MSYIHDIRAELRYLVRELGLLDKNCFGTGLSLTQAHLLTYLFKNGITSFNELQIQLTIDKASLSRMLTALIEKDYVESLFISKDKRVKHFRITTAGQATLSKANSIADKDLSFINVHMENNEAEALVKGLSTFRKGAFRRNCARNPERILIERLRENQRSEVDRLLRETFFDEQKIPDHLISIPEEYAGKWWVARSGEYLLGAVACWQENDQCHWGRFAVEPEYRGMGIGRRLALTSLKECFQHNNEIIIEARDTTVRIITQLGGDITGEAFDFYGMPVTPMRINKQGFEKAQKGALPRP
ncbi:GNAT family N-acetyltransferase [Chimaeribacter arupi]|uniref:GNAT family N-acetyltransferase n=1 Tax=Chimaeribacter arupi TaxID=2060066 RepID=UPI002944E971|nr:GNAT family N-acetyltransferase [Chimaeribacter arupi]MDV5140260.1 GNAT family N-acetyltransferase [Chimaeribacter arupi]